MQGEEQKKFVDLHFLFLKKYFIITGIILHKLENHINSMIWTDGIEKIYNILYNNSNEFK